MLGSQSESPGPKDERHSETWLGLLNIATRSPEKFSTFADSIARTWRLGIINNRSVRPGGPSRDSMKGQSTLRLLLGLDRAAVVEPREAGRRIAAALSVSVGTVRRVL
jgi:hypothetical protein